MVLSPHILILAVMMPAGPTAAEVVARMIAHETEQQAMLRGYTAIRRYVLENRKHHKRAEMRVRLTCRDDGSKHFEVVSMDGWNVARRFVFPRLLEAETEAARPGVRAQSLINTENYKFQMAGTDHLRGRPAYIIEIEPKISHEYLIRGRIWVDADEYAIVRIEGKPAKNPSFWIKSIHFVHDYDKNGPFWFSASDRSVTDVRFFGPSEMTIEYLDYVTNAASLSGLGQSANNSAERMAITGVGRIKWENQPEDVRFDRLAPSEFQLSR